MDANAAAATAAVFAYLTILLGIGAGFKAARKCIGWAWALLVLSFIALLITAGCVVYTYFPIQFVVLADFLALVVVIIYTCLRHKKHKKHHKKHKKHHKKHKKCRRDDSSCSDSGCKTHCGDKRRTVEFTDSCSKSSESCSSSSSSSCSSSSSSSC